MKFVSFFGITAFISGLFFVFFSPILMELNYYLSLAITSSVVILVGFLAHSILTEDIEHERDQSKNELKTEKEKNQILQQQASTLTQTLNDYSLKFGTLTQENIEKRTREWQDELKNRYRTHESYWKSQTQRLEEDFRKKLAEADSALENIKNECEVLSKADMETFYKELTLFLFPERSVSIIPIPAEYQNFTTLRNEIYKRVDIVKEYNANMEYFKQGLKDFKFRPYIYTTLAEAYKNRIIADYCTANFKQNEIFGPVSRITSELQTMYLETLALRLSWGHNIARDKKVTSIRELRSQTKIQLEEANYARYQLDYLLELYPQLQDALDVEHKDLDVAKGELPKEEDHDATRDYLSREEYDKLSVTERNQLALDRYIASRKKSKWQIGRDYELYIGYRCKKENCHVEYTGSTMKLEDLGRDLIATLGGTVYIIQCKYWSKDKLIREKHIMQLYGTVMEYKIANNGASNVHGVFVTSTALSDMAKRFAKELNIKVYENIPLGDFPRIKCNINHTAELGTTYIYHLPMDLSYDVTKIENPGEFMAFTVKEAEQAGFRRSYRWHGQ